MNRLAKVKLWRDDTKHNLHEQQITLYQYDKRGLVTREINAANNQTIYVYDGMSNMVQKTDASGYVTTFGYDTRNLAETINYAGGKTVNFQLLDGTAWRQYDEAQCSIYPSRFVKSFGSKKRFVRHS